MSNGQLRRGDIVVNTSASPGYNDLLIVTGGTKYVEALMLFDGKLRSKSQFDRSGSNLRKIGHFDVDKPVIDAMNKAREEYES